MVEKHRENTTKSLRRGRRSTTNLRAIASNHHPAKHRETEDTERHRGGKYWRHSPRLWASPRPPCLGVEGYRFLMRLPCHNSRPHLHRVKPETRRPTVTYVIGMPYPRYRRATIQVCVSVLPYSSRNLCNTLLYQTPCRRETRLAERSAITALPIRLHPTNHLSNPIAKPNSSTPSSTS